MQLVPRVYQTQSVEALWQYFCTHMTGNPVVALPTGTGKAFVIALFLQKAFAAYAHQKVLVMTHVKDLIDQNYLEFLKLWPTAPAGVYSAGLKRKDVSNNIIFCGIASVNKNVSLFGHIDLIVVDECHLLSQDDESMYQTVIRLLTTVNPNLRVIGLTATPWRHGQGRITDDGIFTDICYDATTMVAFNWMIKQGYLAPLIPKQTQTTFDLSGVHVRGGEFVEKELQAAMDRDDITYAALQESIVCGHNRKCWLVFGTGIKHVETITAMLNYLGIKTRCVHSKMPQKQRDINIKEWKEGVYPVIVNNGMLTTGINNPRIDMIVMLRATHSVVLWIQMLGRGTRPWLEKLNCMVMDFAGNARRLGPINDPVIPRKRGEKTGEVPIKVCDHCQMYNHISARFCGGEPFITAEGCGAEFRFKTLLQQQAGSDVLIKNDSDIEICTFKVETITFNLHTKIDKPDSMKVTYWCGLRKFNEYILFEHTGFGQRKARMWWAERSRLLCPQTTGEALRFCDQLLVPTHIKVWVNTKYPEIKAVSFTGAFEQTIVGDEVPF
jgi:DNA repair protein RadD